MGKSKNGMYLKRDPGCRSGQGDINMGVKGHGWGIQKSQHRKKKTRQVRQDPWHVKEARWVVSGTF